MAVATKARKTAAALCVAASMACGLGGCTFTLPSVASYKAQKVEQTLADTSLLTAGTLTVSMDQSNPPQSISGDKLTGYAVDVAHALADRMGLGLSIVNEGEEADIYIGDVPPNVEGANSIGTYAEDATAIFGKASQKGQVTNDTLNSSKIGVQGNSASQDSLARANIGAEQVTYSSINACFDALKDGDIDLVACDTLSGSYLARIYDGVTFLGTIANTETDSVYTVRDAEGLSDAVVAALDGITGDGVLDAIHNKWFGDAPMQLDDQMIEGVTISSTTDENADDAAEGTEEAADEDAEEEAATTATSADYE